MLPPKVPHSLAPLCLALDPCTARAAWLVRIIDAYQALSAPISPQSMDLQIVGKAHQLLNSRLFEKQRRTDRDVTLPIRWIRSRLLRCLSASPSRGETLSILLRYGDTFAMTSFLKMEPCHATGSLGRG